MKKSIFLYIVIFLLLINLTYAAVPDSDADGVPDEQDNCPNSQTDVVDQFGCSCSQKNCLSDNNICTDDCSVVNGLPACGVVNNNKPCGVGLYCSGGECINPCKDIVCNSPPDAYCSNSTLITFSPLGTCNPKDGICSYTKNSTNCQYGCKDGACVQVACGDGIINQPSEECDEKTFGPAIQCVQSSLKCTSTCKIDTSGCISTPTNITIATNITSSNLESVLVIVAGIGNIQPTANVEKAKELVFGKDNSVNDYYNKASFGQVSLTGDVVGPYKLNESLCYSYEILDAAIKAADPDVYFPKYSRIILDVPRTSCIWVGGEATIGNRSIQTDDGEINVSVSWDYEFTLHVVGHELGHNFGMAHANSMECFSCNSQEYGDFFDIMGSGNSKHINSPHKEELGWLGSDNIVVTSEGEYLLKPLETKQPKGALQQIKLPLKVKPSPQVNKNAYYSLEFRQSIDYDIGYAKRTYEGVFIHLSQVPSKPYLFPPNLINYGYFDFGVGSLLQVGKTYKDESNNYDITLKSISSDGALVNITKFTGTNQKPTGSFDGFKKLDFYEGKRIEGVAYGWAIDPDAPNEQIYVNVYVDGDISKGYLFQSWKTSTEHKFEFSIPSWFKDGEPHEMHIYATDTWNGPLQELNNSPQIYKTEPKVPLLSITPTEIKEGDDVALKIADAQPYSYVIILIKPSNKILPFGVETPSLVIGSTDSNGEFSTIESSLNWQAGSYDAEAKVGKFSSNAVTFVVTDECGDGICKEGEEASCPKDCQKQGCTDSDGGLNYYVKGISADGNTQKTDSCYDNNRVREFFCVDIKMDSNNIGDESYTCPNGCNDGACIPAGLESYPKMFLKNNTFDGVFVVGDFASGGEVIAVSDIMASFSQQGIKVPSAKLASEICAGRLGIPGLEGKCNLNQNIISVGSACSNAVTSEIEGKPADCRQGLNPGEGKIKLYSNNNYYNLVVKGYNDDRDTRATAKILAYYKNYNNLSGQEYTLKIEYKCTDSDGKDIYVKGTAVSEGPAGFASSISDYCIDGFSVNEALCDKDGTNFFNNYGCLYGCKEGACLKGPVCGDGACDFGEDSASCPKDCPARCTDSDGGDDYYVKGTTTGLEAPGVTDTWQDYCGVASEEINKLVEYVCDNGYGRKILYECPIGCKDGACSPVPLCGNNVCEYDEEKSCPQDCMPKEIEVNVPSSFSLLEGQSAKVINYKETKISLNKIKISENQGVSGGGGKTPPPPPATAKITVSNQEVSSEYDINQGETINVQGLKISFSGLDTARKSAMFSISLPDTYTSAIGTDGGSCWISSQTYPYCGGGFGTPASCPAGSTDMGVQTSCGNPNSPTERASNPVIAKFFELNGWGCPSGYALGASIRTCSAPTPSNYNQPNN